MFKRKAVLFFTFLLIFTSLFPAKGLADGFSVAYDNNSYMTDRDWVTDSPPVDSNTYETGTKFTVLFPLAEGASPKRQLRHNLYYSFVGWNTKKDGTGDMYQAGDQVEMGTSPVTLYAQWRKEPITPWAFVGGLQSALQIQYRQHALAVDEDGTPYVALLTNDSDELKATVMKYTGTGTSGWEVVGEPRFTDKILYSTFNGPFTNMDKVSLHIIGKTIYLGYNSNETSPIVYEFKLWKYTENDGWQRMNLGDDEKRQSSIFYKKIISYQNELYILNSDYKYDDANRKFWVVKYDSSNDTWERLTENLEIKNVTVTDDLGWNYHNRIKLAIDRGTPYLAYIDPDTEFTTVTKYTEGTGWETVGQPGFTWWETPNSPTKIIMDLFVDNGTPYVAMENDAAGLVMKYTGDTTKSPSGWEALGGSRLYDQASTYSARTDSFKLTKHDGTLIAAYAYFNAIHVAKYNGSTWQEYKSEQGYPNSDDSRGAEFPRFTLVNGEMYVAYEKQPVPPNRWNMEVHVKKAGVDNSPPTVTTYAPTNGATDVALDANLVLTFNKNVSAVASKNIRIKKKSGAIVETIAANDTTKVTVSDKQVTINPAADLEFSIDYYVEIDQGSFTNYDGIANSTTWSFKTAADTRPPLPKGKIAVGRSHSVALKDDGTVWTWGWNNFGQLGTGEPASEMSFSTTPKQVSGLANVKAVDASWYTTFALKNDGTVWGWGELGNGSTGQATTPVQVMNSNGTPLTGVVATALGDKHMLVLKEDGTVWAWGANNNGEIGTNPSIERNRVYPGQVNGLPKIKAIYADNGYSIALDEDGNVWGWGANYDSQLGDGTTTSRFTPKKVAGISQVTSIATIYNHVAAIKSDGTVWGWGDNNSGQLGEGAGTSASIPVQLNGLSHIRAISATPNKTTALHENGTVYAIGHGRLLGNYGDETKIYKTPVQVVNQDYSIFKDAVAISSANGHTLALKNDGTLVAWGINMYGELGNGSREEKNYATPVPNFSIVPKYYTVTFDSQGGSAVPAKTDAAEDSTIAAPTEPTKDGYLFGGWYKEQAGNNAWNFATDKVTSNITLYAKWIVPPEIHEFPAHLVAPGIWHTVAAKKDGTVWGWGTDTSGQLGQRDDSVDDTFNPIQKLAFRDAKSIATGRDHTAALKKDGTVWTWGNNDKGQLGVENVGDEYNHVKDKDGNDLKAAAIRAGLSHTVALKEDGTVWGWGEQFYNQLDLDFAVGSNVPVQVKNQDGSDFKAVDVASTDGHSIALKSDGSVWGWGYNEIGQLGIGNNDKSDVPVQVKNQDGTDFKAVAIATGEHHSVAIKNDGTVWTWGANGYGELGDGTKVHRNVPVQVKKQDGSPLKAVAIGAGQSYSVAVGNDGTVWAWGKNDVGQLGNLTYTDSIIPVQVLNQDGNIFSGAVDIASGLVHSIAVTNNGTLVGWGQNTSGQVGDGTRLNKNYAMPVGGGFSVEPKTFTVTFDSQNGSDVAPLTKVAEGSTITAPEEPIRDGYTFGGWYKEKLGTNKWNFAVDKVNANITLYAKWNAAVNPASAKKSTVTVSPDTVAADGIEQSTITVELKNEAGAAVAGKRVSIVADGGSSQIQPAKVNSDTNGKAVFTVTNQTAEQVTYKVKDETDNLILDQRAKVTFESKVATRVPSVLHSTVTASPDTVAADGAAEATITVTLKDANGNAFSGKTVSLQADGGSSTITPTQPVSDADGKAIFKVKNQVAEQVTYSATDITDQVNIAQTAQVTFESPSSGTDGKKTSVLKSTVKASPDTVVANGTAKSTITVTLLAEDGTPVSNKTVSLKAEGDNSSVITATQATSDADGKATFTVTNTAAEQVTYTATDDTDHVTLAETATVTFESPATYGGGQKTDVLNSTVHVSPAVVAADGTEKSTITVTLKDRNSSPVKGKTVQLFANSGNSQITNVQDVSDENGEAIFTVTNTVAEQISYTVKDITDEITLADKATVTFESASDASGPVTSLLTSTVVANPLKVTADGSDESTITVTLKDENGNPIEGHTVKLEPNGGDSQIAESEVESDADGKADFTVTNETAEVVTYTAIDLDDDVTLAQQAKVTFENDNDPAGGGTGSKTSVVESTIDVDKPTVNADGSDKATITVTLRDVDGNPVAGETVTLSQNGGSSDITPINAVSDADGKAVFEVTNNTAEQVTYSATAEAGSDQVKLEEQVTVTFESDSGSGDPNTSVIESDLDASPTEVLANGTDSSTITVTVRDENGTPIEGKQVKLFADGNRSDITPSTGVASGADGKAVFTVTNTKSEQVTYRAVETDDNVHIADTVTVTFKKPAATGAAKSSVERSTVTAAPTTVVADGSAESTITVVLMDTNGNPVSGKTVSLTPLEGNSTITDIQAVSGADGKAIFTVKNGTAEQVIYFAKDVTDNVVLAQKAMVTFEAPATDPVTGEPLSSVTNSTITALPAVVDADGTSTSTITVTLKDARNQPLENKVVSLTASGGSSSILPAQGTSNSQGEVVFTVTNTKAEQVDYSAFVETDQVRVAEKATVTFLAPAATGATTTSVAHSTVTASPETVKADGTEESIITVVLKDASGNAVSGKTVSLTPQQGTSSVINPLNAISDADGKATFKVTNTAIEQVTYTAKDETDQVKLAQTAKVTFESQNGSAVSSVLESTVNAVPSKVEANGTAASTITVTLLDSGKQPVSGKIVSLTANRGSSVIAPAQGTSNAQGEVVFTVTNTKAEQITYSAKDETDLVSIAQKATVTFQTTAGGTLTPSVARSTVTATPAKIEANGTEASTITVVLKDANGNAVSGKTVKLSAVGGSSVITEVNSVSDGDGKAVFTVTNNTAEVVTYRAKDETDQITLAQTANVTFESPAPVSGISKTSVLESKMGADPTEVEANGITKSTITVTLLDTNRQPVSGKVVSLTANGGNSSITNVKPISDAEGKAVFTVTNTQAEQVTYSAKDETDKVSIAEKAKVTFQKASGNQPSSVVRSTVTASKTKVAADGVDSSTITVTLKDVNDQAVSGNIVTLTPNAGTSRIQPASGVSDAEGKVTFTVTNTATEKVTYKAKDVTTGVNIAQSVTVAFQSGETSKPIDPDKVTTDPDKDTVTIKDVPPGTKVTIYDKDGTIIGEGTNTGTEPGTVVITTNPGIEPNDIIDLTATEPGKNESDPTSKTVTEKEKTAPINPNNVTADPEKDQVTVKNVTPGTKVKVYDKNGNLIGEATNPGPGTGPVVISIPGLATGDTIKLTATDPDKKESDPISKTVTNGGGTPTPLSGPIDPQNVVTDAAKDKVTVHDVMPGTMVKVYDKNGTVIGEGYNPGPGRGTVVITTVPGIEPGDTIRLTATEPGLLESVPTSKTVTQDEGTSKPIDPKNVTTDPDKDTVTVKDVPPGTKVTIYDKDGKVIGEGTNPGPGQGPVVITTNPGIKPGDVITITATEPGKKESEPTSKTVTPDEGTSKPIDPKNVTTDPDKDTVTVKDVPPGTKVTIYDKDGNVIGEGTNPGPGQGTVVITTNPGIKPGDVITITATEPGKKESEPTSKTVTPDEGTSKPIDPKNVTTDPDKDTVTVKDVPPGTKVTIYDKDGNVIGEGTNPGPGRGTVVITTSPGIKPGDVITITVTEPGKKESPGTTVVIPSGGNGHQYDVETEWDDESTIVITVTPKPGTTPNVKQAYVVVQGIRGDTPVFVTGYPIDGKQPQPLKLHLGQAQVGDKLYIVVVSQPEYTRSNIGYALSAEKVEIVRVGGK